MINPMKFNKIITKDLDCYDIKKNMYEINNIGEIKNKNTNHILTPRKINTGYLSVNLRCDGNKDRKASNFLLHRLVAEMFIPHEDTKNIVNHKNGFKKACYDDNLEWVTSSENNIHALKTGLKNSYGSNQHMAILNEEQVHVICKLLELSTSYKDILDTIGLDSSDSKSNNYDLICNIKRGKAWKNISFQYDFSNTSYNGSNYTNEQIHQMCRYLEQKLSFKEIYEIMFNDEYKNSEKNKSYYEFIRKLRNKGSFLDIVSQYKY